MSSALLPRNGLLDVRIDAAGAANETAAISYSNVAESAVSVICQNAIENSNSHVVPVLQSDQIPVVDRSKKPHLEVCIKYIV